MMNMFLDACIWLGGFGVGVAVGAIYGNRVAWKKAGELLEPLEKRMGIRRSSTDIVGSRLRNVG